MIGNAVKAAGRSVHGRAMRATDLVRALLSAWRVRNRLDLSFATYSRRIALRLIRRTEPGFEALFVTPVSSVRYWEFPFVWAAIPNGVERCLDVSSPRLLSLRLADKRGVDVTILNPDAVDAAETARLAAFLELPLTVEERRVEDLDEDGFDCAWSISVVEHIAGDHGDRAAMRTMFNAVRPGGRLIVTVPVDRRYRLEYRDEDEYGLAVGAGPFFFQRLYDEEAIRTRLIDAVGIQPSQVGWFGETVEGTWNAYEDEWRTMGTRVTITDPERMAGGYREFDSWTEMPGVGVCGLVFDKPE